MNRVAITGSGTINSLGHSVKETLENMAQSLFKSWFVDFEPVHELMKFKNGNSQYKTKAEIAKALYIDEITLNKFPATFNENGIPTGWENIKLNKVLDFVRGVEPGSKNYEFKKTDENMNFIRVADLLNLGNTYVDIKYSKGKICNENDILISLDGSIGRIKSGLQGIYSTGIRNVKIIDSSYNISNSFVYFMLKSNFIQNTILEHSSGTTILHAGKSINFMFFPLNKNIIKYANNIIEPIFKKILNNQQEIKTLTKTRDTLLPQLITGKIRV